MFKRLAALCLVIALTVTLCPIRLAAYEEDRYTYTVENGAAIITKADIFLTDVVIPSTLGGYPVTALGKLAFTGNAIETITIPETMTSIDVTAFSYCACLKEIIVAENNPMYASEDGVLFNKEKTELLFFPGASGRTEYRIPETVTRISELRDGSELETLTIPLSVTTICNVKCLSLSRVYYRGTPTTKEKIQFYNSEWLLRDAKWYFELCEGGAEHTFENGSNICRVCESAHTHTYEWVVDRESTCAANGTRHEECILCMVKRSEGTVIPATGQHVYDDDNDACCNVCGHERYYAYMVSGATVTIVDVDPAINGEIVVPSVLDGYPVTAIGEFAFSECDNVTSIILPDSVTSIAANAFERCTQLSSIVLPSGVTEIPDRAFSGDVNLRSIEFLGDVKTIGEYAFYSCASLQEAPLPDSVTNIERGAFENCAALKTVTIPNAVTVIPYGAFSGCGNLSSVALGDRVESVAEYAFSGCGNMTSVTLGRGVKSIGSGAFRGCDLYDVFYRGTEEQREQIDINADNAELLSATWHCAPSNGWVKKAETWYFYENGAMVKNTWRKDSIGWCYLQADGSMATNKWVQDSKGWCYVEASGYCATNCWKRDTVGWCYLDKEGSQVKNNWVLDGGKWYFIDANGYMVSNTWKKDSKGWVYLGASGAMLTNAWCTDSVGWCYVGADGYAVTNCWKKDSVGWCYLNANGSMTKNNWVLDGGKWYYLDGNGYMVANKTVTVKGKAYRFNASGVCLNP